MGKKRKRASSSQLRSQKRVKPTNKQGCLYHPTLCLYYSQVFTLREYLLSRLPKSSRSRRRRVVAGDDDLFEKTWVCLRGNEEARSPTLRSQDFEVFSQQVSLTAGSSIVEGSTSQSDLIDFAIWLLFHKIHRDVHRPPHILCHGYQRAANPRQGNESHGALVGIPGIVSHYPNGNVDILKNGSWTGLLALLGQEGEPLMLELALDCGLFTQVDEGKGNFVQLSGTAKKRTPLSHPAYP